MLLLEVLVVVLAMVDFSNSLECTNNSTVVNKRFPGEWENQSSIIMVWPSSKNIWSSSLLPGVRTDIARIANAISKYEPVTMLVNPDQIQNTKNQLGRDVTVIKMESDDLWARDTLPVFMENLDDSSVYCVNFNFNGWGENQIHVKDSKLAYRVAEYFNFKCIDSSLIGEPGGMETDGSGTLLLTESCWIHEKRNPGKSRDEVEAQLKKMLGVTKVIWIKGVKGRDITDAHIDALARFAFPGTVALSKPFESDPDDVWFISYEQAKQVLTGATDATGQLINLVEITEPNPKLITSPGRNKESFLSTYLNYLVVNGAVIMPKFGDRNADRAAQDILQKLYPTRDIVPISIDYLAQGGGGIHCATHDVIGKRSV